MLFVNLSTQVLFFNFIAVIQQFQLFIRLKAFKVKQREKLYFVL